MYFGEGNGNPLQCSCLENLRDGGAWWPAIYGVAQSRTRLERLSSSSSSSSVFPSLKRKSLSPRLVSGMTLVCDLLWPIDNTKCDTSIHLTSLHVKKPGPGCWMMRLTDLVASAPKGPVTQLTWELRQLIQLLADHRCIKQPWQRIQQFPPPLLHSLAFHDFSHLCSAAVWKY